MQVPNAGAAGYVSGGASAQPPNSSFLNLQYPTQRLVIEWTAERVGATPILPASTPVDPNYVLIDRPNIQLAEPNLLADGVSKCYRVSGRYVYGLKKNLKPTDPIPFAAPPWQSDAYGQNTLTALNFVPGIIGPAVAPPTSTS